MIQVRSVDDEIPERHEERIEATRVRSVDDEMDSVEPPEEQAGPERKKAWNEQSASSWAWTMAVMEPVA